MSEQPTSPISDDELARLKRDVPSDDQSIFSSFGDEQSSVPAVLGGMLGLQNKDVYSILERTNMNPHERNILVDMIRQAEHGIGGEVLDIPFPYIGRQVVNYLRASVSLMDAKGHGMSREEIVNIMSNWIARLEARENEMKKQKQGVAG